MVENKQDALARAYAMLSSLRNNIAQMDYNVPEKYVREFHTALDRLEGIGKEVSEFRIPDSALKPKPGASMYVEGKEIFSSKGDICVERPFILTKLDAILGYFEIITSEEPKKIGFRPSSNQ